MIQRHTHAFINSHFVKRIVLLKFCTPCVTPAVVCHCHPSSPWVIATTNTGTHVPTTHPDVREMKCSVEVIKRLNPALCWWLAHRWVRYYHSEPGADGITTQQSLITPHLVRIYLPDDTSPGLFSSAMLFNYPLSSFQEIYWHKDGK